MSKKFTYSRKIPTYVHPEKEGKFHTVEEETFTAVEFDSFEEAKKVVDAAVVERRVELAKENAGK